MPELPGLRLPDYVAERVRDLEEGRAEPAAPRDASTVVLLRDTAGGGIEVYMLRRVTSMPFAPGAYVFPGGSVDARDGDRTLGWAGPSPAEWGAAFGAGDTLARELVCAAVRETFEESGVLLAGPTADTIVGDLGGDDWEADRRALLDRSLSLAALLGRRGLVLRGDLLRPWAHWITPVIEERRYDTRFFVAALPEGQRARDVSTESDRVTWVRPQAAVEAARRGEMALLPPTMVTLTELTAYDSVAAVLAAERAVRPWLPETRVTGDGAYLVLPPELDGHLPGGRAVSAVDGNVTGGRP
ncbi:NUDIX hydrolase [Actinoallomurus spadix]|uniref:Nudix hydrolase domain-containing protein n=1 Tax=Actinoallomurus spadix TaxID=79912 RepID=A0ABN0WUR8_9ACTN|nr:NUDIX hydrolase [Actinoallomurus spadix]MCO5986405.1 NUDIX hydrolase [Actinoallomurus spadix]